MPSSSTTAPSDPQLREIEQVPTEETLSPRKVRAAREDARKNAGDVLALAQIEAKVGAAPLPRSMPELAEDNEKDEGEPTTFHVKKAVVVSGTPVPRFVTLYKAFAGQKLGLRFFEERDARNRGAPDDNKLAVVAMVAEDGAAYGLVERGDRIIGIAGTYVAEPIHAAEILRQGEGYMRLEVLSAPPGMDLTIRDDEDIPAATPRPTPSAAIGGGNKPILTADGPRRSAVNVSSTTESTTRAHGQTSAPRMPKLNLDAVHEPTMGNTFSNPNLTPHSPRSSAYGSYQGRSMLSSRVSLGDILHVWNSIKELRDMWNGVEKPPQGNSTPRGQFTPRSTPRDPRTPRMTPRELMTT